MAIDKIKFVKNHWEHPDGTPIDYEKEIQKYYRNWNRYLKLIEVKKWIELKELRKEKGDSKW